MAPLSEYVPAATRTWMPYAESEGVLGEILGRPKNERAYVNLVVGYRAEGARAPEYATRKKELGEIVSYF